MSETEAVTPGAVLFWATVTESLLVRPLELLVAVTIYLPGADTLMVLCPLGNPVHVNVVLAVVVEAFKLIEGLAQVMMPTGPMVRLGRVVYWVTVTESFLIHPLIAFWTVTTYLPGVETLTGF